MPLAPRPRQTGSPLSSDLLQLSRQRLSPDLRSDSLLTRVCRQVLKTLPPLQGDPVRVEVRPQISTSRGRLLSQATRGVPVYAASFIRLRSIVLESQLLETPELLRSILVHEIFHFVWVRLGNPVRRSFSTLLLQERQRRARGELGESAGVHKLRLQPLPPKSMIVPSPTCSMEERGWRNYVNESFCDSAAFLYAGAASSEKPTLALRYVNRRRKWFTLTFPGFWKI